MTIPVVVDRFIRVVGGQVLGIVVVATIAFVASGDIDPKFNLYATLMGAGLTAFDKYAREHGWYGTSV